MESAPSSPIEAIHASIKNQNPFGYVVKEAHIWGKNFPDVPTLNAHASDAVFHTIEKVRNSKSGESKVVSIAITASFGVGKTHVISRIRHRLEREGGALFVYAGANHYTDLNLIGYQFQQTLVSSLGHSGSRGVTQWQEVAAEIANEGFKIIRSDAPTLSPLELLNRFDKVYESWLSRGKNLMDVLTQKVCQTKPDTDPYSVRAILWTLSEKFSKIAVKWLSSESLDEATATYMGLPSNSSKTVQEKVSEALREIQKILNLVSYYNPVLICFDEIDVTSGCNDEGFVTSQVVADLVKRLYDTLSQSESSKGVVILSVMFPDTWKDKIKIMSEGGGTSGAADRISTYTAGKPIDLKYIDGNSMVELVRLRLKEFYEEQALIPPHSLYPFEENQLREYGQRERPTVREALKWCYENFKVEESDPLPAEPRERFSIALELEGKEDFGDYMEDNALIAQALSFGFQTLRNETLEGATPTGDNLNQVVVDDIVEVEPKSKNQGWLNFKVIGREADRAFKLGIAVLQQSHGISVGAGMKRLIDYKSFDLTRGCLVRSRSKKIRSNWESSDYLKLLVDKMGGEWVDLKDEDVKPLIILNSIYSKRDVYELSEEQVLEFSKLISIKNPLLLEILSSSSSQVDEEMLEGEQLLEDFLSPVDGNEPIDDGDLEELFN